MPRTHLILVDLLLVLTSGLTSQAALTLHISDGVQAPLTVTDNGPGDSDAAAGSVSYVGSYFGWFVLATGTSKPLLGSTNLPLLDLNYQVSRNSGSQSTVTLLLGDTDFNLARSLPFQVHHGGTFGSGTATNHALAAYDLSNAELSLSNTLFSAGFSGTGNFYAGQESALLPVAPAVSFTICTVLGAAVGQFISGDSYLQGVNVARVTSITRLQPATNNLATVQWAVNFDTKVSALYLTNFFLTDSGLPAHALITVVANGPAPSSNWIVSANAGAGAGSLGLSMTNGAGASPRMLDLPFTGPSYTIDRVPPEILLTDRPPAVTNSGSAVLAFTASDVGTGISRYECVLDEYFYTNCVSPVNLSNLSPGPHYFQVRAYDGAGNVVVAPGTASWTIYVPPLLRGPAWTGQGSFRFGFHNEPGLNFLVLATTNVSLPLSNWAVAGVMTESSGGHYEFIDTTATNAARRFYKVRTP